MTEPTPPAAAAESPTAAEAPPPAAEAPRGSGPEEPWASRLGLIRPRHGRYVAGVCAAIARATNTDPVLWRVLIGVLSIFGVGIVIYLAGWLLTPAEGDTASPVEALFGRGISSTSSGLTMVLAVLAVILLGALTNSFVVAMIAAIGLVVVALAVNPKQRRTTPYVGIPPADPAATSGMAPGMAPGMTPAMGAAMGPPMTSPPMTGGGMSTTPPGYQPGYQPPFAPHGPYGPGPVPVPQQIRQKPKREPSRLGRLILGLLLVTLGVMGIIDLAYASVPAENYITAALIVVGLGLVAGAWIGRARGFIFLGIILSLALPGAVDDGDHFRSGSPGTVTWTPLTVQDIADSYEHRFGEATLDLSNIDFTNQDIELQADISFGNMTIIVPGKVDVVVDSDVGLGDASIFGREISGAGVDQTSKDDGSDGPGGGTLRIRLDVKFAHAEVVR